MSHPLTIVVGALLALVVLYQGWKRHTGAGNIQTLITGVDLSPHGQSLTGRAKAAHEWLVKRGMRALPGLEAANRRLIERHVAYSEHLKSGPSWNPYENYGRRSDQERAYLYVIELQQARVVDVIEQIRKEIRA